MTTVMIVDDERILVEMIAALVEDMGYASIIATSGQEALASLADDQSPPALIISDITMPQMNGIDLARTLKSDPRYAQVPIILMSAVGQLHMDHMDGVAERFLPKPFPLDVLATLIEYYVLKDEG
jgi:CheY-like chemotaxis protein